MSININAFICIDGTIVCMCQCMLLATNSSVCYWMNVCNDVMFFCANIIQMYWCTCLCVTTTALYPTSYKM